MNLTWNQKSLALAIAGVLMLPCCASSGDTTSLTLSSHETVQSVQRGNASWYSIRTNHGTHTASGARLTNNDATAAHKTLPLGTRVRVTNETNGKSEIVTITDRGPFRGNRIIDLTVGCAERLGFRFRGVAPVKVEVLGHFDTRS